MWTYAPTLITGVVDVLVEVEGGVIGAVEDVNEAAVEIRRPQDTLLTEVPHEELQTDEGKDTQAEHGQDHDVGQLLHRLDEGPNDGLQTWEEGAERDQWNPKDLLPQRCRLSLNAVDSASTL